MMRFVHAVAALLLLLPAGVLASVDDARLHGGHRDPMAKGWIPVHLEGSPADIGYQHGILLHSEIEDNQRAIALGLTHDQQHSWLELRSVANRFFVPKLTPEYRAELEGMAEGLKAEGSKLDLLDLVTMNAYMEFSYYYDAQKVKPKTVSHAPDHCSAFVATGSYTKDGRIVIGHNNWSDYLSATRWNVLFDIVPQAGHHFVMDGMPGLIHSGDDFGINDSGLMITETTISNFIGFDTQQVPEFVRARRAMQYAESIDQFAQIMQDGNNGGYANAWLVGDRKTNEIARLELGLKHVNLERSRDGYFSGANFPINAALIQDETTYPKRGITPEQTRRRRWDELMAENKGKIDVELGKKFETDHFDATAKKIDPNERTLCGHIDRSRRGLLGWQKPFAPAGVAQVKVADSTMAEKLMFEAAMGHPCGVEFHAAEALAKHKELAWQQPLLRDLKNNGWLTACPRTSDTPPTSTR